MNLELIKEAYIKYKSYVYYDKSILFTRRQIAIFESSKDDKDVFGFNGRYSDKDKIFDFKSKSIEDKLSRIVEEINNYSVESDFFNDCFNKINLNYIPKAYVPAEQEDEYFITNKRIRNNYIVDNVNIAIDLPVELQIISTLWIMLYGFNLDSKLDSGCLGNRLKLNKNKNGIISGSSLFHPYHKQYQKWRDDGIKEAKTKLDIGNNVVFLNLDVKQYFYSIRLNFETLEKELSIPAEDKVHAIFKKIHQIYTDKVKSINFPGIDFSELADNDCLIPIGIPSSYVIANWYLKDFDKEIRQQLNPAYYSRYVDDIIILLINQEIEFDSNNRNLDFPFDYYLEKIKKSKYKISFSESNLSKLEKFLLKKLHPIIQLVDLPSGIKTNFIKEKDLTRIFRITNKDGLYFQPHKTYVYFFDASESTVAIDNLKKEIEERSSEFRDFPEESESKLEFDEKAYHLIFEEFEDKKRTLKHFKENRFGLSVFLANRIFSSLRRYKTHDQEEVNKILKLFKGINCLENYQLWEKIFTYLMINQNHSGFVQFYKETFESISKIEMTNEIAVNYSSRDIQTTLFAHLHIAMEMVFALNPVFFEGNKDALTSLEYFQNSNENWFSMWTDLDFTKPASFYCSRFRESNLIRHDYVVHSLSNYTKQINEPKFNLVNKHL